MLKRPLSTLLIILLSTTFLFAEDDKVFALVLSGGGARGLAHVPIIEELEKRGIIPDIVIGTSMGGLVGGLYAAGYDSQDLYNVIEEMDIQSAVFSFTRASERVLPKAYDLLGSENFSLDFTDGGIGSSDSVLDDWEVNSMIHSSICRVEYVDSFDDLSIPFRTVGTDYGTGRGIVFDSGSFYEALRGTMSMPVFFPALVLDDGTYVVDGGVYNNIPIDLAREMGADIVLAVDVNESVIAGESASQRMDTVSGSLDHYLALVGQVRSRELYELADYVLIPDVSNFWVADFANMDAILEAGRECVEENKAIFDALEAELGSRERDEVPSYFDKEPMTIEGFRFDESIDRFEAQFADFIGRPYDEETVAELDHRLSLVRSMTNKKTLSYSMKDGIVHVSGRDYNESKTSLRMGLENGLHSFTHIIVDPKFRIVVNPDFHLAFDRWYDSLRLTAALKMGQQNTLSFSSFYLFSENWAIDGGFKAAFGGFSSVSDRSYEHRYPTRDWNLGVWADLSLLVGISHRLDFELGYDFYHMGSMPGNVYSDIKKMEIWDRIDHHYPYAAIRYNFDGTHLESDHETGVSFKALLKLGWDEGLVYNIQSDLDAIILLTQNHCSFLDLSLSLFSSRGPVELIESFDIDSFGQLSSDSIYFDVGYRYFFFPHKNGFYGSAGLFAEFLSRDNIPGGRTGNMAPFTRLDGFETGVVLALGYVSDFGNLVATCHLSVTGRLSLTLALR